MMKIHRQFEDLYEEANPAADTIAERVVALGGQTIPTLKNQWVNDGQRTTISSL